MNNLFKKGLAFAIILLFIGLVFVPIISGNEYPIKSKNNPINQQKTERATIYLGYYNLSFSMRYISFPSLAHNRDLEIDSLYFNASLEELVLEIVMNYTAEMNYTQKFPFALAPLVAFGIKINDYTDYCWESFKLKNHGYFKREGNISFEVYLDLTNIGSGDELTLYANTSTITVPFLYSPNNNLKLLGLWGWLLRFVYNLPIGNKLLLHNWLLPILAPYNLQQGIDIPIRLYFD